MAVECPDSIAKLIGPGAWTPYTRPPRSPDPGSDSEPDADLDPGHQGDHAGDHGWTDHTWAGRSWTVGRHLVRANSYRPELAAEEHERTAWLEAALDTRCPSAAGGAGDGGPEDEDADESGAGEDRAGDQGVGDEATTRIAVPGWLARPLGPGAPGHRPDAHPKPDAIPTAIGRMLRWLHQLDPDTCPHRDDRSDLVAELAVAVEAGRLAPGLLPSPYNRYPAERLLELIDGAPTSPDPPVVGHGTAILDHFWIPSAPTADATDDDPVSADRFLGLHRLGVADRHADLAVVHRQLQSAYGPEAVFAFYEAYGTDPRLIALDHYLLIDAVRAALVPGTSAP